MVEKKNKPNFSVRNVGLRRSRLKNRDYRWRRPRADSNKKKMKLAFAGASPCIGYRNPPEMRGLHPCGFPEVLVHTESELVGITNHVVRIASAVGAKKAARIEEAAKSAKLRVLNPRRKKKAEASNEKAEDKSAAADKKASKSKSKETKKGEK